MPDIINIGPIEIGGNNDGVMNYGGYIQGAFWFCFGMSRNPNAQNTEYNKMMQYLDACKGHYDSINAIFAIPRKIYK